MPFNLSLDSLIFQIPDQAGMTELNRFQELSQILKQEISQETKISQAIMSHMLKLEKHIDSGEIRPEYLLRKARDIRLLFSWWRNNPSKNLERLPLSKEILTHCIKLNPRLPLQALFGLINLYFEIFDQIYEFENLTKIIKDQLEQRKNNARASGSLLVLITNRHHLFQIGGPDYIVKLARTENKVLKDVAVAQGLPNEAKGRFYEHCQQLFYLETLKQLSVGEEHEVLQELARNEVHETKFKGGFLLGHEVIRIIINKAKNHTQLSDNWLHLILNIAGDPRISTSSVSFTRWWAILETDYTRIMRGWLSQIDLKLFLEILEDYSNQVGGEIKRMFPAREVFLRGLFDANLIADSRLFLSTHADTFVRANYNTREMPNFVRNSDSERSVFYLNIEGFHIFEGTHNFYFWIHRELPTHNPSNNYELKKFDIRDLGMGLMEKIERKIGVTSFHVSHNGNWQYKVITEFQRLGIKIDPATVLIKSDYKIYRQRYGISV
ncbi:MAG: hypothetical protein KAH77_02060 [Thiomargarita sp.]|nr:hypothetical protein [Thiomargarita sp.]